MGKLSNIEWTDHTWSPWWGCTKVSRGCKHCYAETLAKRTGFKIWGDDAPRRNLSTAHWLAPFSWNDDAIRKGISYKVFPSMCDPFEKRADLDSLRDRFLNLITQTRNLQWLLLTKRPEELCDYPDLPPNAHIIATVEGNSVKSRIADLRRHRMRYGRIGRCYGLSVEPLVEPLDLRRVDLIGIDWVIVGGESNSTSRMEGRWVQNIYEATHDAGKSFLFKQWGDAASLEDKKNFAHLERVREFPAQLGPAVTKK